MSSLTKARPRNENKIGITITGITKSRINSDYRFPMLCNSDPSCVGCLCPRGNGWAGLWMSP